MSNDKGNLEALLITNCIPQLNRELKRKENYQYSLVA